MFRQTYFKSRPQILCTVYTFIKKHHDHFIINSITSMAEAVVMSSLCCSEQNNMQCIISLRKWIKIITIYSLCLYPHVCAGWCVKPVQAAAASTPLRPAEL